MQVTTSAYRPLPSLTVLEILDRTFRIYRANFLTCIALAAGVIVPTTILSLLLTLDSSNRLLEASSAASLGLDSGASIGFFNNFFELFALTIILSLAVVIIQQVVLHGTVTYIASESYFGQTATLGAGLRALGGRAGKLSGALITIYLILFGLSILLAFVFFVCGLGIGMLLYLWVALYSYITPVIMLENLPFGAALRRAWALGRWRFWSTFWVVAGVTLLGTIISLVLSILQGVLIAPGTSISFEAVQIASTALQTLINVFLAPLLPIALTVAYYDTRVKVEGLDFAFALSPQPDPRPSDVPSPIPTGPIIEGRDVGNMMILAVCLLLVVVALYAVLFAFFFASFSALSGF